MPYAGSAREPGSKSDPEADRRVEPSVVPGGINRSTGGAWMDRSQRDQGSVREVVEAFPEF